MKIKNNDFTKNARKRILKSIELQEKLEKEREERFRRMHVKFLRQEIEQAEEVEFEEIKEQ